MVGIREADNEGINYADLVTSNIIHTQSCERYKLSALDESSIKNAKL